MKDDKNEGSITVLEEKKPNVIVLFNNQPTGLLAYETEFNQATILLVCPPILDGKAYSTQGYKEAVFNILKKDWPDRLKTLLNLLGNGFQYLPIKAIKTVQKTEDNKLICTFHNTDLTETLDLKSNALDMAMRHPLEPELLLLYLCGAKLFLPLGEELYFPYLSLP